MAAAPYTALGTAVGRVVRVAVAHPGVALGTATNRVIS